MRLAILGSLLLVSCATVPSSYVKRVEKLEREVKELREETERLREEARRLREALRKSEEYESRIREAINEEYRKRGSFVRPPKAK